MQKSSQTPAPPTRKDLMRLAKWTEEYFIPLVRSAPKTKGSTVDPIWVLERSKKLIRIPVEDGDAGLHLANYDGIKIPSFRIYEARCIVNGKAYIGQTIRMKIADRRRQHYAGVAHGSSAPFHRALRKHGFHNFVWSEILQCAFNLDDLNRVEEYLIARLNTLLPNGYNAKTGGKNSRPTKEIIEKMRANAPRQHSAQHVANQAAARRGKKWAPEVREKFSQTQNRPAHKQNLSQKAKQRWHDPEYRAKMRQSMTGVKRKKRAPTTEQARANMRKAQKGKHVSPETRAKISKKLRGVKQGPATLQARANMSAAQFKAWRTRRKPPTASNQSGLI